MFHVKHREGLAGVALLHDGCGDGAVLVETHELVVVLDVDKPRALAEPVDLPGFLFVAERGAIVPPR
ncbi:hypothetical protein C1876_02530 [Eggerthella sinensis]|uniref:Uncharacterized protein n=1 Tax=Eggerthella sinensis TaxID=242230 RepID=A0A3N0J218_9ACTN|nr:hypothetical protein C1876_02530 [Eggerthella sinensis]RNM43293.1 hypothetical protein DMP09_01140 [Eggerthella sinensis]